MVNFPEGKNSYAFSDEKDLNAAVGKITRVIKPHTRFFCVKCVFSGEHRTEVLSKVYRAGCFKEDRIFES